MPSKQPKDDARSAPTTCRMLRDNFETALKLAIKDAQSINPNSAFCAGLQTVLMASKDGQRIVIE